MKEFIRFVLQIIIGCTLCIGILHLYGQGKDLVVPPKPGPVQVPRVIPPAPRIVSPVFKAKQTGLFEEFMQYISTPCTPILPAFKLAHNPEAVRPWVAKVIQEQHFGRFNLGQVCDVFDHLLLRWKPLDDPTHNELVTAAAALWEMPAGDCDDFSVALSAALTSIGGVTRISFVYNAENQGHAYPEICLGRIDRTKAEIYLRSRYELSDEAPIHMREDSDGLIYLNLDYTASHPGGQYFDAQRGVVYWPADDYCQTF